MIDTFTGWIEGFPTQTEKAEEVKKKKKRLFFVFMKSFQDLVMQSYNGPSFTFKVTQVVSKALDIIYYLHCAWRPQSLRKVERAHQFLKSVIKKENLGDLPGVEGDFTNSSPLHLYCL